MEVKQLHVDALKRTLVEQAVANYTAELQAVANDTQATATGEYVVVHVKPDMTVLYYIIDGINADGEPNIIKGGSGIYNTITVEPVVVEVIEDELIADEVIAEVVAEVAIESGGEPTSDIETEVEVDNTAELLARIAELECIVADKTAEVEVLTASADKNMILFVQDVKRLFGELDLLNSRARQYR